MSTKWEDDVELFARIAESNANGQAIVRAGNGLALTKDQASRMKSRGWIEYAGHGHYRLTKAGKTCAAKLGFSVKAASSRVITAVPVSGHLRAK